MSETRPRKTILSRRVARDMEHERYHPELEQEIKECLYCLECNARMFDLEVDPDLVEQAHLRAAGPAVPLPLPAAAGPGSWGCTPF